MERMGNFYWKWGKARNGGGGGRGGRGVDFIMGVMGNF